MFANRAFEIFTFTVQQCLGYVAIYRNIQTNHISSASGEEDKNIYWVVGEPRKHEVMQFLP